jgi:uncharacterized membrane protein YiaA
MVFPLNLNAVSSDLFTVFLIAGIVYFVVGVVAFLLGRWGPRP